MTPNLLPCPFCGEPASHGNGFSPYESIVYAWCSNNDCQLHLIDNYGFTPELWNTRAKAAPAQPQSDGVLVPRELLMELRDSANDCYNTESARYKDERRMTIYKEQVRKTDELLGGE